MPSESRDLPLSARRRLLQRLALCAALFAAGCAAVPARDPASGCANCPVCLHEADLGCVCVKITGDTPRVEWNGRTWYFCSEECRKAFLSDPKRFSSDGADR